MVPEPYKERPTLLRHCDCQALSSEGLFRLFADNFVEQFEVDRVLFRLLGVSSRRVRLGLSF